MSEHFCSPPDANMGGSRGELCAPRANKQPTSIGGVHQCARPSRPLFNHEKLPFYFSTPTPDALQGFALRAEKPMNDWSKLSNLARKKFDWKHLTPKEMVQERSKDTVKWKAFQHLNCATSIMTKHLHQENNSNHLSHWCKGLSAKHFWGDVAKGKMPTKMPHTDNAVTFSFSPYWPEQFDPELLCKQQKCRMNS